MTKVRARAESRGWSGIVVCCSEYESALTSAFTNVDAFGWLRMLHRVWQMGPEKEASLELKA